jgi:hypothetical protein
MMERQLGVLESNQKQIGEIIQNVTNKGSAGEAAAPSIRQNVFNENRRMMLEMMAPMQAQLNEMKLLYENTKTCSNDVGDKIDELKKVIAVQQANITGAPNPMLSSQTNPALMEHYMDPSVVGKGIEAIKEQMRGVQMEAQAIENEMEGRFTAMLGRREAQVRGVPKTLTEELTTTKGQVEDAI